MKPIQIIQKINWKHPKYIAPLVLFPLLLFLGWAVIDIFEFETPEEVSNLVEVQGTVNADMPGVSERSTDIKGKYENMLSEFNKVTDYSAAVGIDKEEEKKIEFESSYDNEKKRQIDSLMAVQANEAEKLREMMDAQKQQMQAGGNSRERNVKSAAEAANDQRIQDRKAEQDERMDNLVKQIERVQKAARGEKEPTEEEKLRAELNKVRMLEEQRRLDSIAKANAPVAVNRMMDNGEQYFNTVSDDAQNPKLIRARVDELVKVKDGSRLRIRLSEDVEIDGEVLRKGSYMYATVSGFGAQRVKAEVSSVMLGQAIKKVKLKVYDLDCMEGFYVPSSNFRDLTKELGAGAMNMNVNMNSNTGQQSIESVAMQTLQQAFQSTTSAVGNQIRKNRAKIKFNTEIYLVDDSSN